jgi:hypothetical protein
MHLHLDCSFGLGGDMFLAGLAGLGLDLTPLESMFREAGLSRTLAARTECRAGMAGLRLHIEERGDQPLRHLPEILALVEALPLSQAVQTRSAAAFRRLAEAEAAVHGCGLEDVHFHEVGAVDTLIDVAGAFWGMESLGVARVTAGTLPWFTGTVTCAHGELPLPAPATVWLLQGKPVRPTDSTDELITPTGALLLDQLVEEYQPGPEGVLAASALAYGSKDLGGGLRLFLCKPTGGPRTERVWLLETNVDHLTGEELGACFDALLAAGALDVLYLPGVMKKNRPGGQFQVLCLPKDLDAVQEAFLRHSLSLGVRRSLCERVVLERSAAELRTPLGPVPAKSFHLADRTLLRPEHEALAALARKTGRSVAELRVMLGMGESGDD